MSGIGSHARVTPEGSMISTRLVTSKVRHVGCTEASAAMALSGRVRPAAARVAAPVLRNVRLSIDPPLVGSPAAGEHTQWYRRVLRSQIGCGDAPGCSVSEGSITPSRSSPRGRGRREELTQTLRDGYVGETWRSDDQGEPTDKGDDMKKRTVVAVAVAVAVLVSGYALAAQVKLDPALAPYKAVSGVSGNISSIG